MADVPRMLDAVGDPVRRRIVDRLAAGPLAVGEIAERMPVGRPAISMHLRRLLAADLVTARRSGNRRFYRLNPEAMQELQEYFRGYWEQAMAAFKEAAEEEASRAMEVDQEHEVRTSTTVTVRAALEIAFRVFVGLRWWPVATHHLGEPPGEEAVLEPFVGGRWYERRRDGGEQDWGTVLDWEPPHRLLLSWQLSSDWTYEPDPARGSQIEVRFTATGPGETLVEYSHRHLERYGEAAERMRRAVGGPGGAAGSLAAYATAMAHMDRSEQQSEQKEVRVFTESMPNLYCRDLPRAVRFYRDQIGFQPSFQFPAQGVPRHVELRLGSSRLALSDHAALAETGLPAPTPGHPQELVVWCEDVDAAVRGLREAGAPVVVEPYDHVAGHRRAYLSDPDGNWVALVGA